MYGAIDRPGSFQWTCLDWCPPGDPQCSSIATANVVGWSPKLSCFHSSVIRMKEELEQNMAVVLLYADNPCFWWCKALNSQAFAQYWFATETFTCSAQEAPGPGRLNGWMVGKHLIWLIVLPCWALRQARVQKSNLNGWMNERNKKGEVFPGWTASEKPRMQPGKIRWLIWIYELVLILREVLSIFFSAFNRLCKFNTRREAFLSVPQDRPRNEATQVMKSSSDDTATLLDVSDSLDMDVGWCGQFQFHINKETMLIEISTLI